MPPTQCCCSPSFGLKASNGDFRGESCSRRGTVSPTEPLPLCPLLAPARWGSLAVRAAHGGTPGTFRSPALRMERCGQRKERQRVEPRSVAAAPLFLGRKKKRKGMGSSSLGDRRGWDPSGRAHLLQAILRPLCFPGISWSQGYRAELLQIPRFWDLLTARRAPEPLCTPSGNVADEGVPAPLRPGESCCRLGAGGGGSMDSP